MSQGVWTRVPQILYRSQTESSKWSCNLYTTQPGSAPYSTVKHNPHSANDKYSAAVVIPRGSPHPHSGAGEGFAPWSPPPTDGASRALCRAPERSARPTRPTRPPARQRRRRRRRFLQQPRRPARPAPRRQRRRSAAAASRRLARHRGCSRRRRYGVARGLGARCRGRCSGPASTWADGAGRPPAAICNPGYGPVHSGCNSMCEPRWLGLVRAGDGPRQRGCSRASRGRGRHPRA